MIGSFICQHRRLVVIVWLVAAAALAATIPKPDATVGETSDLLPADTPVHVALEAMTRHFGDRSALSEAVVVFERKDGPLTPGDFDDVEQLARDLARPLPGEAVDEEIRQITVRTPASLTLAGGGNPLLSEDRRAALVTVSLPYNFITKHAARFVKHAQAVVDGARLSPGLSAAVTGSAGYGYDYAVATENSHRKTILVTLISVICILLLVYRAPVAALIPLAGISVAAIVVLNLLAAGERHGFHSGTAERIFTFVLLYGAGVDYSLLVISRYREFLAEGLAPAEALASGIDASLVAVGASVVMTIAGMAMLCFARFSIFRHAGPAIVLALAVAALAAMTLVPALLAIIGPGAFWPARRKTEIPDPNPTRFWPSLARLVISRPIAVTTVTLLALLPPAIHGGGIAWNYDSMFSLKPAYHARRGTEMAQRHWPVGETAPVTVLAVADQPQTPAQWSAAATAMTDRLRRVPRVDNIRSVTAPLGLRASPLDTLKAMVFGSTKINAEYLSPDRRAMRLRIVLTLPPLNRAALDDTEAIGSAALRALNESGVAGVVHLSGATAEMADIRRVTAQDFRRIALLALAAILLIVIGVLRDVRLSLFILAATLLSYFATLGLTSWIFTARGSDGLEWKVQMLLFIVLVAVGQDYSIFFAVRFAQETRRSRCKEAAASALIATGPVISSCGLIMAATLGSVMAGDVKLLVQLGFAFALGMLIDTFIVRPLLLPAFIVITRTTLADVMPKRLAPALHEPAAG